MISFIGTVLGDIGFDAVLSEGATVKANVTKHPVEFGAEISDHVYVMPATVVIRGGVANTLFGKQENPEDPFGTSFNSETTRSENAWGALETIQAAGLPFSVQTGVKLWEGMVLESLQTERDAVRSNVLLFVATLREVFLVDLLTTSLPAAKLKTPSKGSEVKRGKQQAVPTSLLYEIGSFLGGN